MNNFHSLSNNEKIDVLDAVQKGLFAHSEGYQTFALGNASHAEGQETQALDNAAHAQGRETMACGKCTHAQGFRTKAIGDYSVAMGCDIEVTGKHSVGIHLKKNVNCGCLTQPNTFAIVGGKVGINTLSPQHDFEVMGSTVISSEADNVVVKTTTGKMYYVKNLSSCEEMCNETPDAGTEVVVKDDLEVYVTESELETALETYVTESELETALETYVTESELETTLESLLPVVVTMPFGAGEWSLAYSTSDSDRIDIWNITLNGDVTLLPPSVGAYPEYPGAHDGQKFIMRIKQDTTGSRLLTLGGNFNVPSSITLTLSTDPDALDIITVMYDSSRDKWDVVDFKTGY